MPKSRNGDIDNKSTSVKDAPSELGTAPLLPGTKIGNQDKTEILKQPKRMQGASQGAKRAARAVSRGYKKADAGVLRTTKKIVPQKTLHQLAANRSAHNGNLRFSVPVSRSKNKRLPIFIPKVLQHLRHAALPVALVAVVAAFAFASASPPGYGGTKIIGGAGDDTISHITTDKDNNTYTVGAFSGTVNFAADWSGTDNKTSGDSDLFITKINANSSYGWTKQIGDMSVSHATRYKVQSDSGGNVYVAGLFEGTVNFAADWSGTDNKTAAGTTDTFITKINSDGSYGWTKQIGEASQSITVTSLAIDSSDNVMLTGSFNGIITFDTDFSTSNDTKTSNGTDAFITKINSDGSYGWTKQIGGSGTESAAAIAFSETDNLYITGEFDDTVNFGTDWSETDNKTNTGFADAFITKINSDGSYGWTKQIGGSSGNDRATSIALDGSENIYLAGQFSSATVNFGADWSETDTKNLIGTSSAFITKINSDGSYGWTHTFLHSDPGDISSADSIVIDTNDNIYVAGSFTGEVDFGADWSNTDIRLNTASNSYVTKINVDNSYGWTVAPALVGSAEISNTKLAIDTEDTLYSAGSFNYTVDFGADFSELDERTTTGGSSSNTDGYITTIQNTPAVYKITDASGITYKDSEGANLSSTGTAETNPTVYVHDQDDDTLLATVAIDLTEDRDWSGVSGDSDLGEYAMYLNDVIGAPGADTSLTLYVPKPSGDNAVVLCPGATSLVQVSAQCSNKRTLTPHDSSLSTTTIESTDYWVITGITDQKIGAMSVSSPGVQITETDDSTAVIEGGAGDYIAVSLNAQPSEDVVVALTSDPSGQLESIDSITFTSSNWDDPVNVYIEAIDDNTIEGLQSVHIGYEVTSEDPYYDETTESAVISVDITDNDEAGVVLHNTDNITDETGDTAEICVTLTARPSHQVALDLVSSDTGEVTVPSTISIATDDWDTAAENCFIATGIDDDTVDGPQNVDITVDDITSDDTHFASLDVGTITKVVITNQDDDEAAFLVSQSGGTTTEAGGSVEVCIKLTARPANTVTIPLSVSDSSEAELSETEVSIIPGAWDSEDNCVTVTGVDDDIVDGNVEYSVVTGDPASSDPVWDALAAGDIADITLTNEDNDEAGITITQTDGTTNVTEGGTTDTFSVVLTSQPAPGNEVVVTINPDSQLDLGEGTGEVVTKTFTNANWNTPQDITVTAVDDSSVEGEHEGGIHIAVDEATTETPYLGLDEQLITATITDNDVAVASIAATEDATEGSETNGRLRVSLDKQNNTGSDMQFTYTVDGTAVSGTHYANLSGTATIANGAQQVDIVIDVSEYDNVLLEGNKTVIVTLTSVDNTSAQIGENDEGSITIFDDERATIDLAKTQDGTEDGPIAIIYTATLSTQNDTGTPITVAINPTGGTATLGDDYEDFTDEIIAIPNGESSGTITIPVIDDADFEPETETVAATISNPSLGIVSIGDNDTDTATITDDDTAEIQITATTPTAHENPSANGEITFSLDKTNQTGDAIQISYDISGTATPESDYATLSGSVSIPSGQQSATAIVDTAGYNDDDMEGSETVVLTYTSNSLSERVAIGDSDTATVTIADDEVAGVTATATDDTTSEDGGTGEICFTLASRPSDSVTIALASADSSKVSVPSSLTIARSDWNNANANCVTVTGHDDTPPVATGTEDIIIQTTGVTSNDSFYAALTGNDINDITIHHADNDTPGVIVTPLSTTTSEDGAKSATVQFTLRSQPTHDVTIPLSISDETEGAIAVSQIVIAAEDWNVPAANEVVIMGVDDYLTDGDITYQLVTGASVSDDSSYTIAAGDIADITLTNEDDDEAGVTITQTDGTTNVTEGGATDTFSVVLTSQPASGNEVVVSIDPNDELDLGSGADTSITKTFTNANWNTPQDITVTAVDDSSVEGEHEGEVIVLVDETTTEEAYDDLDSQSITVAITDNDVAVASITKTSDAAESPSSNGAFKVSLDKTNHTGADLVFNYTVSGTAVSDIHYAALTGTVAVSNNQDEATITVDVADYNNELLEGDKTVVITLTDAASTEGTVDNENNEATVTIADDETADISLSVSQHGAEEDTTDIIYAATLSKQNDTGTPITVAINPTGGTATLGDDYEDFSDATVTIAHGASSGTYEVSVIDDELFEPETETVEATISSPSFDQVSIESEQAKATANITDNDVATLTIQASQPNAAENPSANGEMTFSLDKTNQTGSAIQINYTVSGTATADSDYDELPGTVSIPNGQQSATITIDTSDHDDNDMEGDETIIVTYTDNSANGRVTADQNVATVTIADDETAGVTATATDDTTSEDGGTGEICFTLASRPAADVTIMLISADDTKVSVPESVVIARNNWNDANANCATVTGHDDTPPTVTDTQDVIIATTDVISDDPFYAALSDSDVNDITIHHANNDTAGITVQTVSSVTKEDGSKTATVRLSLATRPSHNVTVPISVSDGSEGSLSASSITITPENWNVPENNEVHISGVDDNLIDGTIAYSLITGDPTSDDPFYDALGADDVTNPALTNEDDDVASINISESDDETIVSEDGVTDTVAISIGTEPADDNEVVVVATPANTEIDLGNGAGVPAELTFNADNWQVEQTLTVSAFDDTLLESDHESQITYAVDNEATTEAPYQDYAGLPTTQVHIIDNDTATATLALADGNEAGPVSLVATVSLSKQNDTGAPITLSLNPTGGTATADDDYAQFSNTTVSIPDGESAAEIQIATVDDALLEGIETVEATISNVSLAAVTIGTAQATADIIDNDTATATIIATTPTASENPAVDGEFTVYLSKINNTGAPITVTYEVGGSATASEDYAPLSGSVSIPDGSSSANILVQTDGYDDSTVENNETVILTLQSASHSQVSVGGPSAATVTITDDDGFTTNITVLNDGNETGPVNIRYRVSLSQVNTTGAPFTITLSDSGNGSATASEDYQSFGGTVTIPDGQQSADYEVTVVDDDQLEDVYETVEAVLSDPSEGEIGVASATATITDNDTATASVTASQAEAHENPAENGEFTIALSTQNEGSSAILITYTVNGSATASEDYAPLSGTAMIAPGETDTVVIVDTEGFDDDVYEGDETVVLNLASTNHTHVSVGTPQAATVTILDDESPPEEPEEPEQPPVQPSTPPATDNTPTGPPQPAYSQRRVTYLPVDQTDQTEQAPETPKPQPVDQKTNDIDSDGIPDEEEDKAHNNGDGNGDGIPDSQQDNVASLRSPVTSKSVTLEAQGECSTVEKFAVIPEQQLTQQDKRYKYTHGLIDFRLSCTEKGKSGIVTVYYDQMYTNPGLWRKFAAGSESFATLDFVKQVRQPVGKSKVTAVNYIIRDGGEQDDDGKENGKITDPAGFAVRTFYILDLGWVIPVFIAGSIVAYTLWHRIRDHRRYIR